MVTTAVFDTKLYDREALQQASANYGIKWHFLDFRHTEDAAAAAKNVCAVGVLSMTNWIDLVWKCWQAKGWNRWPFAARGSIT